MITTELLEILQHSLGLDQYGRGTMYRNYFATDEGGVDFAQCSKLVELGLMTVHPPREGLRPYHTFVVTDEGKKVVQEQSPKPPKQTRSQKRYETYLRTDSSLKFGEWLKVESRYYK